MRKEITIVGSKKYTRKFTGKRKITTHKTATFNWSGLKNGNANSSGYTAKVSRKCVQTTEWLKDTHNGEKGKKQVVQLRSISGGEQYAEYHTKKIRPTEEQAIADAERWMKNNPA